MFATRKITCAESQVGGHKAEGLRLLQHQNTFSGDTVVAACWVPDTSEDTWTMCKEPCVVAIGTRRCEELWGPPGRDQRDTSECTALTFLTIWEADRPRLKPNHSQVSTTTCSISPGLSTNNPHRCGTRSSLDLRLSALPPGAASPLGTPGGPAGPAPGLPLPPLTALPSHHVFTCI